MIGGRKSFHYSVPVQHGFNLVRLTLNVSRGFQPLLVSTGAQWIRDKKVQPARNGSGKWHIITHTPSPEKARRGELRTLVARSSENASGTVLKASVRRDEQLHWLHVLIVVCNSQPRTQRINGPKELSHH